MKKLHLGFGILTGIMTLAAIVIALVMFVNTVNNPYTGFPGSAVFVIVGLFYAVALAVEGIIWLTAWLILRRKTCKKQNEML